MRTSATVDPKTPVPLPAHASDWEKEVCYSYRDMVLVIEYLAGDIRSKAVGDGVVIKNEFPVAYGRILGTTDRQGEEVDFYLASTPKENATVYVIDQIEPATHSFDEHKVMLGFDSLDEVVHTYTSVFSDGSGAFRIGMLTTFTAEAFDTWRKAEGSFLRPSSVCVDTGVSSLKMQGISPVSRGAANRSTARDEVGGVLVELPDLSKGPKLKTFPKGNNFDYHMYLYSPLTHETWSNPFDLAVRVMDMACEGDVFHIHIACPGGSVILMGRMISAMNRTKAKVVVYAEGMVASAATAIFCSGHERHIRAGAVFMQHMSSQGLIGKTTDIAAKAAFCQEYITSRLVSMKDTGLFTEQDLEDMVSKSADVYISGREAIARIGQVSTRK